MNLFMVKIKYTTDILEELIRSTHIGDVIKFRQSKMDENGHFKIHDTCGIVMKKFPHIFQLDDGRYYKWVDYMFNKVY